MASNIPVWMWICHKYLSPMFGCSLLLLLHNCLKSNQRNKAIYYGWLQHCSPTNSIKWIVNRVYWLTINEIFIAFGPFPGGLKPMKSGNWFKRALSMVIAQTKKPKCCTSIHWMIVKYFLMSQYFVFRNDSEINFIRLIIKCLGYECIWISTNKMKVCIGPPIRCAKSNYK